MRLLQPLRQIRINWLRHFINRVRTFPVSSSGRDVGPGHAIEVTYTLNASLGRHEWGFVIVGPVKRITGNRSNALAADIGVSDRFVILPAVSYPEVAKYTVGANLGHGLYDQLTCNHNRYSNDCVQLNSRIYGCGVAPSSIRYFREPLALGKISQRRLGRG